jgi:small subunit ribosomal protein S6
LSEAARQYELILMLDPAVEEEAREKLASDAKASIEAAGNLLHEDNWGIREMAYEIDHKSESDYRWFRFEAPTSLLEDLDHNLKIADGIMRFRVFRVDPDDPVLPAPPATAVIMAPTGDDDDRPRRRSRDY